MPNVTAAKFASIRTGERRIMHCGMEAEITHYVNAHHITVRFNDGAIVEGVPYDAFKKRSIANPNLVEDTSKRVGERRMMNCGETAEVIEHKNCNDITVRFDSGIIIKHRTYREFLLGAISNIMRESRLGEKRRMNCGMEAEIIRYDNSEDITVRFEDGAVAEHRAYSKFIRGKIANPRYPNKAAMHKVTRIGERRAMKCGMSAKIIGYESSTDITVKFEDGSVCEHRTYDQFQKGAIKSPSLRPGNL